MGVPPDQLMASLFDAIVGQNMSVLTRGNTLRPHVLLLGGPNTFIRGMVEAWRHAIPIIWKERKTPPPDGVDPTELIRVPESAQYFAAIGAVQFGLSEEEGVGVYRGTENLRRYIDVGRLEEKQAAGGKGLAEDPAELEAFKERYRPPVFEEAVFTRRGRGGVHRPGRRLHLHQGRPARQGPQRPGEELPASKATPSWTPRRCSPTSRQLSRPRGPP